MSETLNGSLKNMNGAGRLNTQIGVFAVFTIVAGYLAYYSLSGLVSIGAVLGYGPIGALYRSMPGLTVTTIRT